jgi:uncharacterized protein YbdZ (MbtH family)
MSSLWNETAKIIVGWFLVDHKHSEYICQDWQAQPHGEIVSWVYNLVFK